jgi:hypothetical protein
VISERYKNQLMSWVINEKKRKELSDRGLAAEIEKASGISVTHRAVQYWRSGKLVEGLSDESVRAIAAYRNETPEETRAWLEGRDPYSDKESRLVALMRSAPLPEVTAALEVGLARLSGLVTQGQAANNEASKEVSTKLVKLIQFKLDTDGIQLEDLAHICKLSEAMMRQLAQGIILGDPQPRLTALAPNLYNPHTKRPFGDWGSLAGYLEKAPVAVGEQDCEHQKQQ